MHFITFTFNFIDLPGLFCLADYYPFSNSFYFFKINPFSFSLFILNCSLLSFTTLTFVLSLHAATIVLLNAFFYHSLFHFLIPLSVLYYILAKVMPCNFYDNLLEWGGRVCYGFLLLKTSI